ncbi:MAG: AAA family ATPase [Candidatus Thermoplasmatota archaeon]|nr:AAA family ATPase [Candidatus Thermoplasmatota archaeon]MBU4070759.1 AAA family ATPase [Candidatus Thermoplasmatota archaeon]MBU4144757.1 AAA family ATPase [Candidatus Thermoplasmatota archaeon]MBU4591008.1 AAA family ATPase [Candidatus Thermoplasmatota archaeon]
MTTTDEDAPDEFMQILGLELSRTKVKAIKDAGYVDVEALSKVTLDEIIDIKGISKKLAQEIYYALHLAEEPQPAESKDEIVPEEWQTEKSEDEIMLEKGLELHSQGKWGQALQIINDMLEKDVLNTGALMAKAKIYLDREKYQMAVDTYDQITEINPEMDGPWVGKGEALMAMDQKVRAMSCFKKALALNPANEIAQEKLGEEDRLPTSVDGLDELLEGGIPAKHVVLICGRAGSMKSSFSYYVLHKLSEKQGRKTVYMSLEQSRQSLLKHMRKLGLKKDTKNMMVSDMDDLVVVDMAALRKESSSDTIDNINWPNSIINQLRSYKESFGCDAVVIDSLSALYSLTTFKNPRSELFFFFEKLRDIGVTVFLISEMCGENQNQFGQYGVEEFLADGIIHIKTEEYANRANLFLGVVKMRETNHPRDYFPLIVDQFGFGIVKD